ncbi:DUF2535 family protein [Sutcliffiella rhizosphaerae]|uniref:DUF2535 family protein n=1 Tax=Sutcliffiella rhizosphaerae TaxID=2880967 RepID=A0ABN8ACN7_9BACI|nr:DUF2535 family protein [Sutcliffiella rhizosphaerae]CAG9622001.1 hypothetical protein BACCIP111883_02792 [Sutcliffiella rhizosphaerae]
MLWKSLEFTIDEGQKVKVIEIPVLEDDSTYHFMIRIKLESYIRTILSEKEQKQIYSFKEYLRKELKWTDYCNVLKIEILKNNA